MGFRFNPITMQLDLVGDSGGSGSGVTTKYNQAFVQADWILDSGDYIITIPFSTHAITNPTVVVFEELGPDYEQVYPVVVRTITNNIILKISSVPDNRFDGLITII